MKARLSGNSPANKKAASTAARGGKASPLSNGSKPPLKRGRGRPSKAEEEIKVSKGIALTPAQWAKLDQLRGSESRGDFLARVAKL
jgi:hypothetical protein